MKRLSILLNIIALSFLFLQKTFASIGEPDLIPVRLEILERETTVGIVAVLEKFEGEKCFPLLNDASYLLEALYEFQSSNVFKNKIPTGKIPTIMAFIPCADEVKPIFEINLKTEVLKELHANGIEDLGIFFNFKTDYFGTMINIERVIKAKNQAEEWNFIHQYNDISAAASLSELPDIAKRFFSIEYGEEFLIPPACKLRDELNRGFIPLQIDRIDNEFIQVIFDEKLPQWSKEWNNLHPVVLAQR